MTLRTVHASALALWTSQGPEGLLLTGEAGSGKSSLLVALLDAWAARGRFAALVADDRVALAVHGGRLVARAPEALAGLVEVRGVGILARPHLRAARLHRHVALGPVPERLPDACERAFEGVALPSLTVPDPTRGLLMVRAWLQERT